MKKRKTNLAAPVDASGPWQLDGMRVAVSEEYLLVWRRVCGSWLAWPEERFERFLRCWNARLSAKGGDVWFCQGRPFQYVIPLLLTDQFEEFLHHKRA
jgi:hypothetical protein